MTRDLFHVPVSNETLRVMAATMHCLGTTIPFENGVAFVLPVLPSEITEREEEL